MKEIDKVILNGELKDYRSRHKQMRIFAYEKNKRSRDILSIAYSLFNLEKLIRTKNIRQAEIKRYINKFPVEIKQILTDIISYVLLEKIDLNFYLSEKNFYTKKYSIKHESNVDAVVLFSGGVDSLAGIKWALNKFDKITPLFCAHSDQARIIKIVNGIEKEVFSKQNLKLKTLHVPEIQKGGYSQLRGFLYILSAGALLDVLGTDSIVLSEIGPTMFQPRFGPFDTVTMTTHPFIVDSANKILNTLLERKIKIYTPFRNMTKAEVTSYLPDDIILKKTHSCITQRFGDHDGTCYGCIIRRLGAIVADKNDVEYNKNPLIDENANADNLLSLLLFSQDILLDYKAMPFYQKENIETYSQHDLFKRFSLDNMAAVHILHKQNIKLTKSVRKIYNDFVAKRGVLDIENRIEDVRGDSFGIYEKWIT